jgi:hypothetical protein
MRGMTATGPAACCFVLQIKHRGTKLRLVLQSNTQHNINHTSAHSTAPSPSRAAGPARAQACAQASSCVLGFSRTLHAKLSIDSLACRQQGLVVQGFKVGPDFLDPMHHAAATGRPSINLDGWMMTREQVLATFHRWASILQIRPGQT